jgi:hypothetical protein
MSLKKLLSFITMSKKKYLLGIIFLLTCIFSSTIIAKANNPTGLNLAYNSTSDILTAEITHGEVSSGHYIEFVEIEINGTSVRTINYTSQATNTVTYAYSEFALSPSGRPNAGDIIRVTAICSISGSITRTLTVGGSQGEPEVDDTIPGYLGVMIFISATIFITSLIIHKKIKKQ